CMTKSELDAVVLTVGDRMLLGSRPRGAILFVHESEESCLRSGEAAGFQTEDLFQLATPPDRARRQIAGPGPHSAASHGEEEDIVGVLCPSHRATRTLTKNDDGAARGHEDSGADDFPRPLGPEIPAWIGEEIAVQHIAKESCRSEEHTSELQSP